MPGDTCVGLRGHPNLGPGAVPFGCHWFSLPFLEQDICQGPWGLLSAVPLDLLILIWASHQGLSAILRGRGGHGVVVVPPSGSFLPCACFRAIPDWSTLPPGIQREAVFAEPQSLLNLTQQTPFPTWNSLLLLISHSHSQGILPLIVNICSLSLA